MVMDHLLCSLFRPHVDHRFSYTVSVYYVEFLSVFNKSKGDTAWVSALNYGALCVIGKLLSIIISSINAELNGS